MNVLFTFIVALAICCLLLIIKNNTKRGWREAVLIKFGIIYTYVIACSELLSLFNCFRPNCLIWAMVSPSIVIILWCLKKKYWASLFELKGEIKAWCGGLMRFERVVAGFILGIIVLKFVEGIILPPATRDAVDYHIPRYYHWFENGNLSFYQTAIHRQNYIVPGFSLLLACVEAVTGTDYLLHSVQFLSYLVLIIASTLIASILGASSRGQFATGVVVATTPVVLAQTTVAVSDILSAVPLVGFCYFYLDSLRFGKGRACVIWSGVMAGLAMISKTQGALFIFALTLLIGGLNFFALPHGFKKKLVVFTAIIAILGSVFIAPHSVRNYSYYGRLSGSNETAKVMHYPFSLGNWAYTQTCRTADLFVLPFSGFKKVVYSTIKGIFPEQFEDDAIHYLKIKYTEPKSAIGLTFTNQGTYLISLFLCLIGLGIMVRDRRWMCLSLLLGCFIGFSLFSMLIILMPWDNRFFMGIMAIGVASSLVVLQFGDKHLKMYKFLIGVCILFALPAMFYNTLYYVPGFVYRTSASKDYVGGKALVKEALLKKGGLKKVMAPSEEILPEFKYGYHYLLINRDSLYWGSGAGVQAVMAPAYKELVSFLQENVKQQEFDPGVIVCPYDSKHLFPLENEAHYWRLAQKGTQKLSFITYSEIYEHFLEFPNIDKRLVVCGHDGKLPSKLGLRCKCRPVFKNKLFSVYEAIKL